MAMGQSGPTGQNGPSLNQRLQDEIFREQHIGLFDELRDMSTIGDQRRWYANDAIEERERRLRESMVDEIVSARRTAFAAGRQTAAAAISTPLRDANSPIRSNYYTTATTTNWRASDLSVQGESATNDTIIKDNKGNSFKVEEVVDIIKEFKEMKKEIQDLKEEIQELKQWGEI